MHTSLHRVLLDTTILTYLVITALAFLVTMTHWFPPSFLRVPILFSYGMMAPYQGASDFNKEMVLIGIDEKGTVTDLKLDQYFPGLHGERNSRQFMEQFFDRSPDNIAPYYTRHMEKLDALLKRRGTHYASYELWAETWPRDPKGYRAGRERGVTRTLYLRYP